MQMPKESRKEYLEDYAYKLTLYPEYRHKFAPPLTDEEFKLQKEILKKYKTK